MVFFSTPRAFHVRGELQKGGREQRHPRVHRISDPRNQGGVQGTRVNACLRDTLHLSLVSGLRACSDAML